MRQFQNNARQILGEVQNLGNALRQNGAEAGEIRDVDEALRRLREMTGPGMSGNPRGMQDLSAAATELLKKVEFSLRKRLDTSSDEMYLSGADEAPAAYRPMVEEYYRQLSRQTKSPAGGK